MQVVPLLLAGSALTAVTGSDDELPDAQPRFAEPVALLAGDSPMGSGRYYPSPVFRDMNGDGRLDVVIGDLMGSVTVAHRKPGDELAFGEEKVLERADGEELDFNNW